MSSIEDHELPKANVTRVLKQSVIQEEQMMLYFCEEKQAIDNIDSHHCLLIVAATWNRLTEKREACHQ